MHHTTAPATHRPTIEVLETRIAPASVFTFTDVDGDLVTVKASVGTLDAMNFSFSGPLQTGNLEAITLGAAFDTADLTITVKAVVGGNGSVNVGYINAVGVDLKNVSIAGDLGRIDAGAGDSTAKVFGVGSLTVDSIGRGGVAVQGAGGSLVTFIDGALGKLKVKRDIYEGKLTISANVGSVDIGGSLIGGVADQSGLIFSGSDPAFDGAIGSVKIGGSIIGGAGVDSGQIFTQSTIGNVNIGNDVRGGTGDRSGWVYGADGLGAVSVKGSILGNPEAARTTETVGAITTERSLTSLTVGGDIVGGAGFMGGYVFAGGAMGAVKITGDVRGDDSIFALTNTIADFSASFNGGVQSGTSMGNVSVGGSVIGGYGNYSGVIFVGNESQAGNRAQPGVGLAGDIGKNDGIDVPLASSGKMGTVTIKGSVIGGGLVSTFPNGSSGAASGWIKADGSMGAVKISGDVIGAVGAYSGAVQARGAGVDAAKATIASVTVGGSVRGGQGYDSGAIFTGSPDIILAIAPFSTFLGPVKITGSLIAGPGNISGTLYGETSIKSVNIGGSIMGDSSGAVDGVTTGGGAIVTNGDLGAITIKGGVYGEFGPNGGGIYANFGGIKSVSIGRDLTGSTSTTGIFAAGTIGSVSVGGSIIGAAPGTGVVFILSDTGISKLSVKGRVENADILAGSDYYNATIGAVENADAQIGPVSVGLDWVASNLAAGTNSSNTDFFGFKDAQSVATFPLANTLASRIASITIKGSVFGTPDTAGDGYGFFAQQVGSLKIRGVAQVIPPAAGGTTKLGDPDTTDVLLTTFGGS